MATSESTIQIRLDAKTKREARKTLEELGLDMSSAVKLFLHNVIITQSIPLDLRTKNGFTIAEENNLLKEVTEAKKLGKRYSAVGDLMLGLES